MSYPRRTVRALGDAVADSDFAYAADQGSDPYLNAIRAISVPMGQLQATIDSELNDVSNADSTLDMDLLVSNIQQMTAYSAQFAQAVAAFNASSPYAQDASTAAELHNWAAFVADWASSTAAAIPSALASAGKAVGQAAVDTVNQIEAYLAAMIANLGKQAISAILPWVIGGTGLIALVIYGTRQAEKSRTYRKYVA